MFDHIYSQVERYLLGPASQVSQSSAGASNPPPLSALASVCQVSDKIYVILLNPILVFKNVNFAHKLKLPK